MEVERAFDEISCKLGGIDILVPNAGIAYVAVLLALFLLLSYLVYQPGMPTRKSVATPESIGLTSNR